MDQPIGDTIEPRGFRGLSSLVSSISPEPTMATASQSTAAAPVVSSSSAPVGKNSSNTFLWVCAVAVPILFSVYVSTIQPPKPITTSVNSPPPAPTPSPIPAKPSAPINTNPRVPPVVPAPLPTVTEIRPAVGSNLTLKQDEVRYCLSEKIRLEAMKAVVDTRSSIHIRNFNDRVSDYNLRCGKYRYRQSDMSLAQSEVERIRSRLEAAAREAVQSWR